MNKQENHTNCRCFVLDLAKVNSHIEKLNKTAEDADHLKILTPTDFFRLASSLKRWKLNVSTEIGGDAGLQIHVDYKDLKPTMGALKSFVVNRKQDPVQRGAKIASQTPKKGSNYV